jgi:hypothetical protein
MAAITVEALQGEWFYLEEDEPLDGSCRLSQHRRRGTPGALIMDEPISDCRDRASSRRIQPG